MGIVDGGDGASCMLCWRPVLESQMKMMVDVGGIQVREREEMRKERWWVMEVWVGFTARGGFEFP